MSEHTPGPWEIERGADEFLSYGCHVGPAVLLFARHPMGARCEADARLIAAAPDLLEALKDIEEYGVRRRESHGDTLEKRLMDTVEDIKEMARAAIAKATGDSP